ncbi:Protein tssc1 [Coemansia sp. Benny D115]|nr:Protein tssc1 [Coemansia sp. Benny D115]
MVIESAHQARIRTLDYNPNLPYMIATGADDGHIRIWDARSPMLPLLEIANHSHWIYSVRFNHNHDQLLLSAGGDGLVNLESVVSISSAQAVVLHNHQDDTNADFDKQDASDNKHRNDSSEYDDEDCDDADEDDVYEDDLAKPSDGLVAQFDDHETSVYAAVWSQADPWVFASLSFDGRTVINTVPREEKYKILL